MKDLTHKIIGAAIEVHKNLGPGLFESVYRTCLAFELKNLGLQYRQEVDVPLIYKNEKLNCGFRADIIVEDKVIMELKAVEDLLPLHQSQLLTYLRLMNKELGLLSILINLFSKTGFSAVS